MLAAWYDRQGAAADVLEVGELPDPEPQLGEVRVRLTVSGVNPGDTKKRAGWLGNPMAFPRIIPHSDGAGRRLGRSWSTTVLVISTVDVTVAAVWLDPPQPARTIATAAIAVFFPCI